MYAIPEIVTEVAPDNMHVAKVIIFAIQCSNPLVTNANKVKNNIISLAVSSFNLYAARTPEQTNILHKIPLKNNWYAAASILPNAVYSKYSRVVPLNNPVPINKSDINIAPIKFPK